MSPEVARQFSQLPGNLANHLLITLLPLVIGVAISLPLAVVAARSKRLRYPVLAVVSIIQTIPSLALLALMVPLLVALNAVVLNPLGMSVRELGFYPTVIALTLYSMLPILRNTTTGILDVDPSLKEAARGVGMTPFQSLWKVELPLALPVIVAGIRTATTWTVGIATLATPVGQRCLGNYIFQGLNTRNWTAVLFGCIAAALLAVILDLLIGGLQRAAEERRSRLGIVSGTLLILLFVFGLFAPRLVNWFDRPDAANGRGGRGKTIMVGSKAFTEQYILAELIAKRLSDAGYDVRKKDSLGSTIIFDGLSQSEVGIYVDYTGTIWANHMRRNETGAPDAVLQEVSDWLEMEHGIRNLGPLGFENAYALAMRRDQAEQLGITSISDLVAHAPNLTMGGDLEFFNRPEWESIRRAYGIEFRDRSSYAPTFMYEALRRDDVDVVSAFTTDGRIDAFDLVLLDDDRHAIPPYDALLMVSPEFAGDEELAELLSPLMNGIDAETMRKANYLVDRDEDKRPINEAADWLWEQVRSVRK